MRIFALALSLIAFALLSPATPVARAATIIVNSLADTSGGPQCTLRNAITAANTNTATGGCIAGTAGADTIRFSVSGTITLNYSLPTITQDLTIDSAGQSITISGNNAHRVFDVGYATLNLNAITIANGGMTGGGIVNFRGSVNIANCIFRGNHADFGHGGGIFNIEGIVTVTNSTFSGNNTNLNGGGIHNQYGTVNVTNTTFSGNRAYYGGGIYNYYGTVTITNTTFSGNSAYSYLGGGIMNLYGTVTISNSTFSGNNARESGGGIFNYVGTVTVRNTIIANSPSGGNCGGDPITNGGNNIDSEATCNWGFANGSRSNTNPLLGPLANNGGSTQTMALLAGSPAIDGVKYNAPNGCPPTDQRGIARPQLTRCDIGAFEYQQQPEVPEMNTLLLLGGGLGGIATWLRWKWQRARSRQK